MSLKSLIATGTKVWSDSIDPKVLEKDRPLGISGATSNPIIIAGLIKSGAFDEPLGEFIQEGMKDPDIAWHMADHMVHDAQETFWPIYQQTQGNDGYVSFELDPLLEDPAQNLPHKQRVQRYIELGKQWSQGHSNRMIKVPATAAGIDALEELVAAGVTINVTLCFTEGQYFRSRDAIWRGAQRHRGGLDKFKSVYSIFVSRVDVYTAEHVPELSEAAQGQVGIANAKHIWRLNQEFWKDKNLRLKQEIIFASTGTKLPSDPPDKYVEAFAGSDIQTNPPATNDAVEKLNKEYTRKIDQPLPKAIVDEITQKVDIQKMEDKLMEEGIEKFAKPQNALLELIAKKRASLGGTK
jgi:transaldolase